MIKLKIYEKPNLIIRDAVNCLTASDDGAVVQDAMDFWNDQLQIV